MSGLKLTRREPFKTAFHCLIQSATMTSMKVVQSLALFSQLNQISYRQGGTNEVGDQRNSFSNQISFLSVQQISKKFCRHRNSNQVLGIFVYYRWSHKDTKKSFFCNHENCDKVTPTQKYSSIANSQTHTFKNKPTFLQMLALC